MSIIPFLGLWIRFAIVYQFSLRRMDQAIKKNEPKENSENVKYGSIGLILIFILIFLYILIFK